MTWWNPYTWFEKEKLNYPYKFAVIEVSPIAKSKGINDDSNKIIKIFENGKLKEELNYTKQLADAIKEEDEIPIFEQKFDSSEEFEFYPFEDLEGFQYKK